MGKKTLVALWNGITHGENYILRRKQKDKQGRGHGGLMGTTEAHAPGLAGKVAGKAGEKAVGERGTHTYS